MLHVYTLGLPSPGQSQIMFSKGFPSQFRRIGVVWSGVMGVEVVNPTTQALNLRTQELLYCRSVMNEDDSLHVEVFQAQNYNPVVFGSSVKEMMGKIVFISPGISFSGGRIIAGSNRGGWGDGAVVHLEEGCELLYREFNTKYPPDKLIG